MKKGAPARPVEQGGRKPAAPKKNDMNMDDMKM